MRIISKIIVWILSLILIFIVANLSIWSFHMKSVSGYMQQLNEKDWSAAISQVTVTNPASIFSIFYVGSEDILLDNNTEINIENTTNIIESETEVVQEIINTWDNADVETWKSLDPYDPEFEDDFNSFFGWEEESGLDNNTWELLEVNEKIWFDTSGDVNEEEHTVAEELIKKFNE